VNAETLMLAGGTAALVLTLYWVRSRDLGERHALTWVAVATLLFLCGLFPQTLTALADAAHLSYPAAVLFIALGVVYVFAFSVSVTLTRLHRRSIRLMQQVALLEARVRELEAARAEAEYPAARE
jgi:hypothetical protein